MCLSFYPLRLFKLHFALHYTCAHLFRSIAFQVVAYLFSSMTSKIRLNALGAIPGLDGPPPIIV